MNLVDEQQRLATARGQAVAGRAEYFAQFLDPFSHRTDLPELAAARPRQQTGQSRLARAGWTEQDHRSQPVGFEQAPQQFPLPQEMLLADELLERLGAHAGRQGLRLLEMGRFRSVEQ